MQGRGTGGAAGAEHQWQRNIHASEILSKEGSVLPIAKYLNGYGTKLCRNDLKFGRDLWIWNCLSVFQEDVSLIRFIVSSEWGQHDVTCVFAETVLQSVNCHCQKMEREEIPCAHVFRVLQRLDMRDIPRCCVAVRWTMQAKDAFEPERNSHSHVWTEQMDRYRGLRNMANTSLYKASLSIEETNRVIDFFKTISIEEAENDENDQSGEIDNNKEPGTFGPLPAYFSGSQQAFTGKVLDPLPIKPRGAPCKKRPKAFYEKWSSKDKGGL